MNNGEMLFTGGLETFFTVPEQLLLFLCSVMAGAALGVVYDVFRALRITLPFMRKNIPTALSDIVYMLIFGISIFILSAYIGRGQVRFFYCLGAALGALLYILTAGNAAVSVLRSIMEFLGKGLSKITAAIKNRLPQKAADNPEQQADSTV